MNKKKKVLKSKNTQKARNQNEFKPHKAFANQLFVAVKLENKANKSRSIWLQLPATATQFYEAVSSIYGESDGFTIKDYSTNLIGLKPYALTEKPLSFVNYLASQLKALTDEETRKLTAIMTADEIYWDYHPERVLEYTIAPENYTLIPYVFTNEELVFYYFKTMQIPSFLELVKDYVKSKIWGSTVDSFEQIGENLCWQERGIFTPLGYIKAEVSWHDDPLPYFIPRNWHITDENGEEIYGRLPADDTEEDAEYIDDDEAV